MSNKSSTVVRFLALLLPSAYTLAVLLYPPAIELRLQGGEAIAVWRTHLAWQLRWLFWAAALLIPVASWPIARHVRVLAPLSLLPLATPAILLSGALPRWILSTALFYVPTTIVAVVAWRFHESVARPQDSRPISRRHILAGFIIGSVLFACLGLYFTNVAGGHVGDEAHYRTMAQSLYRHHTLDLKPLMVEKIKEAGGDPTDPATLEKRLKSAHRNPKSRDGHWYSTHSYGLSLMLAPFEAGGNIGRHIALGLIAGLACAGMLALCLVTTDGRRPEILLVVLVLALSNVWAGYAVRTLPETLGAALLVWAYWAVSAQSSRRWSSLLVAAACCIYMPFAHVRYIPLSLLAFGFYGLYGLFGKEPWGRKIPRLGVFTILCVAGYLAYYAIQSSMFDGGDPYRVTEVPLVSVRMGAWWSISDTKGLVHILPAFTWLLGAQFVCLVKERKSRPFVAAVLIAFMANIMLSCTTPGWRNGSSLPGKKLVVILPLLLPGAVIALRRSGPVARRWLVFLAAVSVSYMFITTVALETIGRSFHHGPLVLGIKLPALQDLLDPHVGHGMPYATWPATAVSDAWVLAAFLLTAVILFVPQRRGFLHVALVALICGGAVVSHVFVHMEHHDANITKRQLQRQLQTLDMEQAWVPNPFPSAPLPLNDTIADSYTLCSVTTDDLGKHVQAGTYSLPRLERNDWEGRRHKWATLVVPFRPVEGSKILSISGKISGNVTPVLALREGAHTIVEQPLTANSNGLVQASFAFKADGGRGDMYVLMRLEGNNGTFLGENLRLSAGSARFMEQSGLTPPPSLTHITNYP
ncbi:hypothetical protein ACFLQU_03160 [Verrucomicrobiota bacterium]